MRFILRASLTVTFLVGCSTSDSMDLPATGGRPPGSGGQTSTGGAPANGGAQTSGGSPATGGQAHTGGSVSTGGSVASGGNPRTGGVATGGNPATGGSANDGGTEATGGSTITGGARSPDGGVGDTRFPDGSTKPDTQNPGGTLADGGTGAGDALSTDGYCPATEPCRISPLGDSITEGMGWNYPTGGGYRSKLFSLALKDAKNITFVGTRSNGPNTVDGKPFPKNHEGTSGITIQNLQSVVDKGALTGSAVKPHIILIHLGTNNLSSGTATSNAALLDSFLGSVIKNAPHALLVVAQIIPFNGSEKGFNAAIPAIVDKRAKEGAHIIMVDQSAGFTSADIADGVHPNEGGYAKMAAVWYKAIAQHLH